MNTYFFAVFGEKKEDKLFIPFVSTLLNCFWAVVSFAAWKHKHLR